MFRLVHRVSFAAFTITAFVASGALAADYYVATDGADTNAGTESKPFKTVRKATEAATAPGDTVYIRGGVYGNGWDSHLSPQASGTASAPITFRAYPGELPILDGSDLTEDGSGFEPTDVAVEYIRVEGLVARNWPDSGFSNGWNHPSSNIEFVNCIADNNGVNGIAFNKAASVHIEHSITLHNGNLQPSWSSGVSLYTATGTNRIIGNVAFENIDISSNKSDGSGFILDEGSSGALFQNNLAFFNGGSCIRLTKSPGGRMLNNTCVQNAKDSTVSFNDEIYVSDAESTQNAVAVNNLLWPGKMAFGGQAITQMNNVTVNGTGTFVASSGAVDLHLTTGATSAIDQGTSNSETPADDVGFDFKCIKAGTGLAHWWQYVIDYDYVESVGGVAGCFAPGIRTGTLDVGAYEFGAEAAGCTTADECADTDVCTQDACGAGGKCTNIPVEGCCTEDADCADTDACTTDTCDVAMNQCSNAVQPDCGEGASGEWTFDAETGYVSVCDWGGYHWSAAGPEEAGVNATTSAITEGSNLCYTGLVAAQTDYGGYAMAGFNIRQVPGEGTEAVDVVPEGDGLNISITNTSNSPLRVQVQNAAQTGSWCVEVTGSGGFFEWSQFNTACWAPDDGVAYAMEPVNVIAVMVAGSDTEDRAFDFCVNQLSPSNAVCDDPVGETPTTPSPTGTTAPVTPGTVTPTPTASTPAPVATDPGPAGVTCPPGLTPCGTTCVDMTSDAANCGQCAMSCGAGLCSQSACVTTCPTTQQQCGQACVDTQTSLVHCGTCNTPCQLGQTCSVGQCVGQPTGGPLTSPEPAAAGCGCHIVGDSKSGNTTVTWLGTLALIGFMNYRRRRAS